MVPPTTFGEVAGRNVFAGNHVSGGSLNVTIHEPSHLPRRREPFSTVPFLPDPDFIERTDVATWLHDTLIPAGSRAALVGLGGVGKSQLAIQYAHRIQQQTPGTYVFWVHAGTRARFEEAYRSIADSLELPRRHDPGVDVLRLVYDWLFDVDNGQWLIIVDNADDIDVFYPENHNQTATAASTQRPLASLLPQSSNGRILVTSRSRDVAQRLVGSSWSIRLMQPMDKGQALQLLRKKLRDKYEDEPAASLVRTLDYIPLAITQAAAYILRRWPRTSFSTYLEQFRSSEKKRESLLHKDYGDLRRDAEATNSVVLTWQITFEQIQKERRSAANLLSFMSFFHAQGIPEWILHNYSMRRHEYEGSALEDGGDGNDSTDSDELLDDDLETLRAYSLVGFTAQQNAYEMHALVQLCTRVWLSSVNSMERWRHVFLRVMSKEHPDGEPENWMTCQQLEPHIAQIIETEPLTTEGKENWAQLLNNAAWYRWQMGRYGAAEAMLRKAVEIREKILGGDRSDALEAPSKHHLDMLISVDLLAIVLEKQGKYEEAEQLHQQALNGREKALGKDHPDTLRSASNLALVFEEQGKHEEAEQMNRAVLDSREKAIGKEHPDTLISASNLAWVLIDQGKHEEADQLHRRVFDSREKVLGRHHPDTLDSVQSIAWMLGDQGKHEEAEQLNRRTVDSREKLLGKDHPDTLSSVQELAWVLKKQGKYEEAEQVGRRALDGREKVLGKDHPDTLSSVKELSWVLRKQGKYEEAEQMDLWPLIAAERR
ncbi:hypothetical protein PFICI_14655 [Pestalotiopsis fici W106-1]|uniref:DUF7779 domain-containing protein n=1 Tax=Pestalotiopsis fici (strain W106-1 / CGMCC3.15140) TaxID=1229662 RepID=W3WIV5_PESFW|nr:uncharacterized protein PFICI_14655 [Pestalotiopsis fici W106-1]ETS73709.1 hypothetical protein PFICI_14655 [Pestalotiopsis fici W106-1]